MVRGLYTAGTGMISQMEKMNVISNNVANLNTTGFKQDDLITRSFEDVLIKRLNDPSVVHRANQVGPLNMGVHVDQVFTRFEQGALHETNNYTDLAVEGDGFFVIETQNGERYTRDGAFQVDSEGRLTTKEGNPVQGQRGEINVGSTKFVVNSNGDVFADGVFIDTIRVVGFDSNDDLRKEGSNLYYNYNPQNAVFDSDGEVIQGYLEGPNIDLAKQLVNMIETYRNYESNQKVIKMIDDTLSKAVNEIGRI
jgi:flagellar basal-body rod protein FlgF